MSWEDEDHLDETWLPAWGPDDKITPEDPEPPKPTDNPPEAPLEGDCKVNHALWWLVTLSEGPPPCGDWMTYNDEVFDYPIEKGYDIGSFPCLPEDWDLESFRESDGFDNV